MKRVRLIVICIIVLLFSNSNVCYAKEKKLRILCAASLQESFKDLSKTFKNNNSAVDIELNFAGTQQIYNQVLMGIEADLFVSANEKYSKLLIEKKLLTKDYLFAQNTITIAVYRGSHSVKSLEDITKPNTRLAIAHKAVPVGEYTNVVLDKISSSSYFEKDFKQSVLKNIVTKDLSVQNLLAKIILGEVDAGFIYKTNITPNNHESIREIAIPKKFNTKANYYIGILKDSKQREIAKRYIEFVLSEQGQAILKKYKFDAVEKVNAQ